MNYLITLISSYLSLISVVPPGITRVGGYAVGYHGYPRAIADIDIWIEPTIDNAKKILQVLSEFSFDKNDLSEDIFLQRDKIVRYGHHLVHSGKPASSHYTGADCLLSGFGHTF